MIVISKSEFDDFHDTLRRNSYDKRDFSIEETDLTDWSITPIAPIVGNATIRRISTGKEMTYRTGHFSTWLNDFSHDLLNGVFD